MTGIRSPIGSDVDLDEVALGSAEREPAAEADEGRPDEAQSEETPAASVAETARRDDVNNEPDDVIVQRDDQAALLVDLARAMHEAAEARHERALEAGERRRIAFVEGISERGRVEAGSARDQADRDTAAIQEWTDAEIERIRVESDRRRDARERELAALLERYDAQTSWEIGAVDAAVADHHADLETFFARLGSETDVGVIARVAMDAPRPPDLESVSEAARARAAAAGSWAQMDSSAPFTEALSDLGSEPDDPAEVTESPIVDEHRLVGVMALAGESQDPDVGFGDSFSAPTQSDSADADPESGSPSGTPSPAVLDTAPESVVRTHQGSGALLEAIPALRPVAAWFNHTNDGNDKRD